MTTVAFYRQVIEDTGMADREHAKRAAAAVLQALRDRLTPAEADQVAAQLPREVREAWDAGERPGRRPTKLHRPQFYARVQAQAGLRTLREARGVTLAVFAALKAQVSPGEAEDVRSQLPRDLKELWEDA